MARKAVRGVKNTRRQFNRLKKIIPEEGVLPGTEDGGNEIQDRAQALAPVVTGTLRDSIKTKTNKYQKETGAARWFIYAIVIGVEKGVTKEGVGGFLEKPEVYGRIIEFGGERGDGKGRKRAKSFLRKSIREKKQAVLSRIKGGIKAAASKRITGSKRLD